MDHVLLALVNTLQRQRNVITLCTTPPGYTVADGQPDQPKSRPARKEKYRQGQGTVCSPYLSAGALGIVAVCRGLCCVQKRLVSSQETDREPIDTLEIFEVCCLLLQVLAVLDFCPS